MNSALPSPAREVTASSEKTRLARSLWLRSYFGSGIAVTPSGGVDPIEQLAARVREYWLPEGSFLFEQGGASDSVCFIMSGKVEHGTGGYTNYVAGDVLGFIDAMSGRPHVHTAKVVDDTVVLRLAVEDWFEFLEEHFDVQRRMLIANLANVGWDKDEPGGAKGLQAALKSYSNELSLSGLFVRRLLALRSCPIFKTAGIQGVSQLMRRAKILGGPSASPIDPAELSAGLMVASQGIMTVSYEIERESYSIEYAPGELICSMQPLAGLPKEFTLEAGPGAELLFLSNEAYFDVMEDHFDVGRASMSYLALRNEQRNLRTGQDALRERGLSRLR